MDRVFWLLILLFGSISGTAQVSTGAADQLDPMPTELEAFLDVAMAWESSRAGLMVAAEGALDAVAALPDSVSRLVGEAQIRFILGWVEVGFGNQRIAEKAFERSMELARRSIGERETSEGYRVLADAYNQLLNLRGTAYKLFNHQAARKSAVRAVELDEENALAHNSLAGYLISAPPIAGGNTRLGVEHSLRAVEISRGAVETGLRDDELTGESRYVLFYSSIWLAKGLSDLGDETGAAAALATASGIYPNNWWLAEVVTDLAQR